MNINTHRKNSIMKERSGFTLIEVMIALTILAVGLLALATMQIVSIRGNAFSTEMTYATMLAQGKLEQLRNMPYDSITSITEPISATATSKGIPYTIQRTVNDNSPATDMKQITLVVLWTGAPAGPDKTGGQTTVQFRTTFTTVIKK
jgi:type IV pilus assembly protein PilV